MIPDLEPAVVSEHERLARSIEQARDAIPADDYADMLAAAMAEQ